MGSGQVDVLMVEKAKSARPPSRSLPRVIGLAVISLVALGLATVTTYTVVKDTLFPETPETTFTCRTGTTALFESVQLARKAAAGRNETERLALKKFRSELAPTWSQAPSVRALCEQANDKAGLKAFRSVEMLRYAEERAVRYSALDLSPVRLRTPSLVEALGSESKEK